MSAVDGFGLANLPYGAFSAGDQPPRIGVRLHDRVVDLAALARAGFYDGFVEDAARIFGSPVLNPLLEAGRPVWTAARARTAALLRRGSVASAAVEQASSALADVRLHLPIRVGDYVDFYSSVEHATNLGKMLRPGGEPLLPELQVDSHRLSRPVEHRRGERDAGTQTGRPAQAARRRRAAVRPVPHARLRTGTRLHYGRRTVRRRADRAGTRCRLHLRRRAAQRLERARRPAWDISRSGRSCRSRLRRRSVRGS